MNVFDAEVAQIHSQGEFSIVYITVQRSLLKLLKLELPAWLSIGDKVKCNIQEASVSICKGEDEDRVSIENRISAKVDDFRRGDVLSEITLNSPCGPVKSLITTDAMDRMEIKKGNDVMLLLKAVDIKLEPAFELTMPSI